MTAPMPNDAAAAGPARPAARPGKTKIPAPIIVPTPMATPPDRPMVRSSSEPASVVVVSSPASGTETVCGDSPARLLVAGDSRSEVVIRPSVRRVVHRSYR
jgi:hypothetical protein